MKLQLLTLLTVFTSLSAAKLMQLSLFPNDNTMSHQDDDHHYFCVKLPCLEYMLMHMHKCPSDLLSGFLHIHTLTNFEGKTLTGVSNTSS